MCSQGDLDSGFGTQDSQNLDFSTFSTHATQHQYLQSTHSAMESVSWRQVYYPALYPHTCLGPVTYMGTAVTKWAIQCLAWGSTLHTVEAISLSTSSTNTAVGKCRWTPLQKTNIWAFQTCFNCHSWPIWKIYLTFRRLTSTIVDVPHR